MHPRSRHSRGGGSGEGRRHEHGDTATAEGSALKVTSDGLTIKVNDATVAEADVMATNGVIDVIDKVLLPPDLG